MKKPLILALAAIMAVSMIPGLAFAGEASDSTDAAVKAAAVTQEKEDEDSIAGTQAAGSAQESENGKAAKSLSETESNDCSGTDNSKKGRMTANGDDSDISGLELLDAKNIYLDGYNSYNSYESAGTPYMIEIEYRLLYGGEKDLTVRVESRYDYDCILSKKLNSSAGTVSYTFMPQDDFDIIFETESDDAEYEISYSLYKTVFSESGKIKEKLELKYGGKSTLSISEVVPQHSYPGVTWKSSNNKIATVDSNGVVVARGVGKCDVTALFQNGYSAVCHVCVATTGLKYKSKSIYIKGSFTNSLKGLSSGAKWSSSNNKRATVNSKGKITGKKKGSCKIYVKYGGKKYTCTVKVKNPKLSKSKKTVYNSNKYRLKVTGGTGSIKWKSSNKKIATVSKKGVVKGKKGGKCTITATRNGVKLKCKITVPKHYEGYSVPDFGALYGKTGTSSYDDGVTTVVYKASKKTYKKYLGKLKKKKFVFVTKSSGVRLYLEDGGDMAAVLYKKGYVAVGYSNIFEESDDDDYEDDYYDDYDDYEDDYYDDYNDYDEYASIEDMPVAELDRQMTKCLKGLDLK